MERIVTYVDGFNLYFGMRSKGWQRYYWLDVRGLAQNLLRPSQQLMNTKYFTARISGPPDKTKRQGTYIEALDTLPNLSVVYGKYQSNPRTCPYCGRIEHIPSEKMTDVNIAVELMTDAFQDAFDTALLISADSDLSGPVAAVRRLFAAKRVVVAFPPGRYSTQLDGLSSASIHIGRATLAKSQLPATVTKPNGFVLARPSRWT